MQNLLNILKEKGLLSKPEVEKLGQHFSKDEDFFETLLKTTELSEEQLLRLLASELHYPFYENLDSAESSGDFLSKFPAKILLERHIAPISGENGTILTLIANPFDMTGVDQLRLLTGQEYEIGLAPKSEISRYLKRYLGLAADTIQTMMAEAHRHGLEFLTQPEDEDTDLTQAAEGASIIRFVNQMLTEAIEMRATDVHIEPFENELQVRYRIDGVLQPAAIPANVKTFQSAIISRIKILSHLDIAEKGLVLAGQNPSFVGEARSVGVEGDKLVV